MLINLIVQKSVTFPPEMSVKSPPLMDTFLSEKSANDKQHTKH